MFAEQRPQGYDDPEFVHLINQLYANVRNHSYAMLELRDGITVLDVGSDVGDDTIAFAQDHNLSVIGVETSPELVTFANQQAQAAGVSERVEHTHITDSNLPFEDEYFDICHVDRMFQYLNDPKPLLQEMARVLKPGGQMLWSESDQGTIAVDCSQQETWWKLLQCHNRRFANPFAGRQLLRYAYWLGLEDVKVQVFPVVITDYDLASYFMQLPELEEQAIKEGILSESAITAWREDINALEQEGQGSGFASINVMVVRGHKPE